PLACAMGGLSACGGWSCGPRPLLVVAIFTTQCALDLASHMIYSLRLILSRPNAVIATQGAATTLEVESGIRVHQRLSDFSDGRHHRCSLSDSDWPSNEGSSSCWLTYR